MIEHHIYMEVSEEYRWLPQFRDTGRAILRLCSDCTPADALDWAHKVYAEAHLLVVRTYNGFGEALVAEKSNEGWLAGKSDTIL